MDRRHTDRRRLLAYLAASAAALAAAPACANTASGATAKPEPKPKAKSKALAGSWPRTVPSPIKRPGVIVVSLKRRMLHLTRADGAALAWPVAVGKAGMSWKGEMRVASKH